MNELSRILHEAFYIAGSGRRGVVVDIPKDIQFAKGKYTGPKNVEHKSYKPKLKGEISKIQAAIDLMKHAKRPVFYTGGGIINSGNEASVLLRDLVKLTGYPITSTLMGLGAIRRPIRNGSACSACTAPTKRTGRCTTAT